MQSPSSPCDTPTFPVCPHDQVFSFFLLCYSSRSDFGLTILKFNSLRRAWKLSLLRPWKLPRLPRVVEGWKLNVMLFFLSRGDWLRRWKESGKRWAYAGGFRKRKSAAKGLECFLPPALTLWSTKSWLGQIYHYALPSVPPEMYKTPWIWREAIFNWHLDDTSVVTYIDFA